MAKLKKKLKSVFGFVVQREIWNRKFVVVARTSNGKIRTWKKWNSKIPIQVDKQNFKQSNNISFTKGIKGTFLTNVVEVNDFSKNPKKPGSKQAWQYVVSGQEGNKKEIVARSRRHTKGKTKKESREEALTSFYEQLAKSFGLDYDEDEGRKIANQLGNKLKIKEGIVYYKKRR